jgi:hypothetical protein
MIRERLPTRALCGGLLTYVFAAFAIASATAESAFAQGHVHPSPGQAQQPQGHVHQPQAHVHRTTIVRLSALALEKGPSDSVRLSSLSAITADVSEGDVHIRLITPGRMRLGAEVSGGRAIRFTATGRHIVVLKGGVGADTITDP